MITNVKEVMDFVYASYFGRTELSSEQGSKEAAVSMADGSHPSDDRNNRRPDITVQMLTLLKRPDASGVNILVTGSKGKGSVSRLLDSILRAHGLKTGLFTSPHLHAYNERICVDGEMILDDDLVDMANLVQPVSRRLEEQLKPGEYISPMGNGLATALLYFKAMETQYNILECGRGARFDDVAVVDSAYAVINTIFDEHLPYLGQSIEDVAWHKAGAIKDGQTAVISAVQLPSVEAVLKHEAELMQAEFVSANELNEDIDKSIEQSYNKSNANLAYTAARRILGQVFDHDLALEAIRSYPFSGCLEMVSDAPRIFMDGCIHPICAKTIAESMNTSNDIRCIVGIPDNKAYKDVVEILSKTSNVVILSEPSNCHLPFAGEQKLLAETMRTKGQAVYHIADLERAIDQALTDLPDHGEVYIIGTQIYIGQAKSILGRRGLTR